MQSVPRLLIEKHVYVPGPIRTPGMRRRRLDDRATAGSNIGVLFDHSEWDALLKEHVTPGGSAFKDGVTAATVNYAGISADARFDAYLRRLAEADIGALQAAEQLALLINAYNALCISLIVKHERDNPNDPPLASILELSSKQKGGVWDQPAGTLCGQPITLSELEHRDLRGGWDEPAVHFCIVCASASCPDLRAGAFTGADLRAQMDEQAALFFANPTKGLRLEKGVLTLSRILWWFSGDFGGAKESEVYATRSVDNELAAQIRGRPCSLPARRYFHYVWQMNRQPTARVFDLNAM